MKKTSNLSKERKQKLIEFEKRTGIRFRNLELLNTALAHKSYVNEIDPDLENNEKLEFLGDAILGFIISDFLYNQKLYLKEGSLARIKSYVVSEPTLYRVGQEMNIQEYLLLGKGEEKSGGRFRPALISDAVEALIGACYLDAGFKQTRKLVERFFYKEIMKVEKNRHEKDYKSILQEYVQKKYRVLPEYNVVDTAGPEHRRKFFITVKIKKRVFGPGIGLSKKRAEQNAAGIALQSLKAMRRLRDLNIERIDNQILHAGQGSGFVRDSKRSKNSHSDAD